MGSGEEMGKHERGRSGSGLSQSDTAGQTGQTVPMRGIPDLRDYSDTGLDQLTVPLPKLSEVCSEGRCFACVGHDARGGCGCPSPIHDHGWVGLNALRIGSPPSREDSRSTCGPSLIERARGSARLVAVARRAGTTALMSSLVVVIALVWSKMPITVEMADPQPRPSVVPSVSAPAKPRPVKRKEKRAEADQKPRVVPARRVVVKPSPRLRTKRPDPPRTREPKTTPTPRTSKTPPVVKTPGTPSLPEPPVPSP